MPKLVGPTPSAGTDAINKTALDAALVTKLAAADGTGLTETSGVLSVNLPIRTVPVAFHIPGVVTTGVKTPRFICPVTGTIDSMRGMLSSGSACTYRVKVNGSTNGTTSASTSTSVITTSSLAVSVSAGDYVQLEVVAAGTSPVDLSVTAAIVVV